MPYSNVPEVNNHIHTPYSFSSFTNVEEAFRMASEENIAALGINDFNTFDGYPEFREMSLKYQIYPLYNIEFMGLLVNEQKNGIRINDPNNPGRIYLSGKGLDFQPSLSDENNALFINTKNKSNEQAAEMLFKASEYLQGIHPSLKLNHDEVIEKLTRGMLRERHIARAVREKVYENFTDHKSRLEILREIFAGKEVHSEPENFVGIENEIRSNLLKSGGVAYVPEDPDAFLPLVDLKRIIRNAGGFPCYPVLLDFDNGKYTEFEGDREKLFQFLQSENIHSIELIPGRNELDALRSFVKFFHQKGLIITFGTEHNSPQVSPLTITAKSGVLLDHELKTISYEGVCLQAAWQHLKNNGKLHSNFEELIYIPDERNKLIQTGKSVIEKYSHQKVTQ